MSNRYQLYEANTLKLIETLVIKSLESAEAINQWVVDYYGLDAVDEGVPSTWKYYKNIAGEYHFTDKSMMVVSWDTLETIEFNKANLAIHRATFRAYAYGTTQYAELVKKYPDQELLILGILNPVDLATAVAADNGSILTWDHSLVEENEYSLIQKLDQWIKSFRSRWVNRQFEITDSLYAATNHAIMYLNLVPAVLNFRLEACKTNEAHSFHITEYLISHGLPEISIIHMTKRQMLFFYRNINYIHRNAGKQDTFDWILDHIMTERYLPLASYVMKHNEKDQLENLYPKITFKKNDLNKVYDNDESGYATLPEMLSKEEDLAFGNPKYSEEEYSNILSTFETSSSNTVLTKVLESSVLDYTETGQFSPEEVLLNHWLYLSTMDRYVAYTGVTNPQTKERIPLSAKDAFILMIYAYSKTAGFDLMTVPDIMAEHVVRIPTPTVMDVMSVADSNIAPSVAMGLVDAMKEIPVIKSTEAFNAVVMEIYESHRLQKRYANGVEHYYYRAMRQNMVNQLYCDKLCALAPSGTYYATWLEERNLNFDSFGVSEFQALYKGIVEAMTGATLQQEPNLASLQRAMIKLFETLSSYSIQFVKEINTSGVLNLPMAAARLGDVLGLAKGEFHCYDQVVNVQSAVGRHKFKQPVAYGTEKEGYVLTRHYHNHYDLQMGAEIKVQPNRLLLHYQMNIGSIDLNSVTITPR